MVSSTSSPDPIAGPAKDQPHSSSKPMRQPSSSPKKPLTPKNGNIRLQDFYLTTPSAGVLPTSSPTRSVAQTEDLISPWRIRVTVEAEKDDEAQKSPSPSKIPSKRARSPSKSPSKGPTGRTITTTVPLKGADGSSPAQPKKRRGRPRKSLGTPVKRVGTPAPKMSVRRRTDEDLINSMQKTQGTDATPPKKRGRPRKSLGTEVDLGGPPGVDGLEYWIAAGSTPVANPNSEAPSTRTKGKGRRKAMSPVKAATDSSLKMNDDETPAMNDNEQAEDTHASNAVEGPMSSPSDQRPSRKSTVPRGESEVEFLNTAAALIRNIETSYNLGSSVIHGQSSINGTYRAADAIVENRGTVIQDPTDEHNEFDSILESEGFTMVSLSSLPSAQMHTGTLPKLQNSGKAASPNPTQQDSHVQSFVPPNTAEQDKDRPGFRVNSLASIDEPKVLLHTSTFDFTETPPTGSEFNTSRLYQAIPQQSPSQTYSSPMLPPPKPSAPKISPPALDKSLEGRPKMTRVPRVDTASQGAVASTDNDNVESLSNTQYSGRPSSSGPRNAPQNDIFSGFGAGSRRELRAGLRLGEELAKRQQFAAQAAAATNNAPDDVFQDIAQSVSPQRQDDNNLTSPGAQSQVEYPTLPHQQLLSPERTDEEDEEDRMSWKVDTPAKNEVAPVGYRAIGNTSINTWQLAREAEWQAERVAVSRQIQEANSSQVIVIGSSTIHDAEDMLDGDDDAEDMGGEASMAGDETIDVWQSEAQHSSRLEQGTSADSSKSLFPDQVVKPKRSKIPSFWRENGEVVYSDEIEPVEEAVQQPHLKHAATPKQSESRKRVKLEASTYSMLSEFAIKPDDESSMMVDDNNSADVIVSNEEAPVETQRPARALTNKQYNHELLDDIDDTWVLDDSVPNAPAPPFEQHQQAIKEQKQKRKPEPAKSSNPAKSSKSAKSSKPAKSSKRTPPSTQPPTSWLTRITSYVPLLRSLAQTTPPPAPYVPTTTSPTYAPHSPPPSSTLSIYLPWTSCHYRALQRLYLAAAQDKHLYPFNRDSSAAYLRGEVIESMGWKKAVEAWEVGVVDGFLDLLEEWGVDDGDGVERIEEGEVARRVFSLWVGRVQRGEVGVGKGTVGMFDERHQWRKGAVLEATRVAKEKAARAAAKVAKDGR